MHAKPGDWLVIEGHVVGGRAVLLDAASAESSGLSAGATSTPVSRRG